MKCTRRTAVQRRRLGGGSRVMRLLALRLLVARYGHQNIDDPSRPEIRRPRSMTRMRRPGRACICLPRNHPTPNPNGRASRGCRPYPPANVNPIKPRTPSRLSPQRLRPKHLGPRLLPFFPRSRQWRGEQWWDFGASLDDEDGGGDSETRG